jgi:hypothetical protein
MRKILWLALSVGLSVSMTNCSSIRVSNSTNSKVEGVPFYIKRGVCKQQTVWLEVLYVITFEPNAGFSVSGPLQKVLTRLQYMTPEVQGFLIAPTVKDWYSIGIASADAGPFNEGEGSVASIKRIQDEETSGNWLRVSNTGAIEAAVDYSITYYLNSSRPLAGSTQVNAKLATDGTLTEASAQVNDQTLATIASTISSLVGSAVSIAKLNIDVQSGKAKSEGKASVKTKIYQHTHYQYSVDPGEIKLDGCLPEPAGVTGGSFTVSEVGDSTAKPSNTDKENTVNFSGSVVLPKTTTTPAPTAPPTPTVPKN